MHDFDFLTFKINLENDLKEAEKVIDEIENVSFDEIHYGTLSLFAKEERSTNEEWLDEILNAILNKLLYAHEYLGLTKSTDRLTSELIPYQGKFGKLEFFFFGNVFYSPVKWILEKHLNAMTSHIRIETESEFQVTRDFSLLERMLRGTAKMLTDRNIEPSNEADVRTAIYQHLIHVFPDTVREIPISKISKSYKPDIGIKSLKSAIEYKFASTETEVKKAIGGVFEDISGYEGSEDWNRFYAVFYMTDHFITQDQIYAEFKLSKAPHHWIPIAVYGYGKRKKLSK